MVSNRKAPSGQSPAWVTQASGTGVPPHLPGRGWGRGQRGQGKPAHPAGPQAVLPAQDAEAPPLSPSGPLGLCFPTKH